MSAMKELAMEMEERKRERELSYETGKIETLQWTARQLRRLVEMSDDPAVKSALQKFAWMLLQIADHGADPAALEPPFEGRHQ